MNIDSTRLLRETVRHMDRLINARNRSTSCGCSISVAQCHVLLEIEAFQPATTGDLAGKLGLDKSTLSRTVENLFAAGLVQRETDDADRRITRLSLTTKGEKACSGINRENDRFFASVFERIPASQRKSVQSSLCVFVEHMAAEMIVEKGKKNKQCKSG